jgi:SAM-dependent methyltransferase
VARIYDRSFFELVERHGDNSAQAVVPILLELLSPASVFDVGCGTGIWLRSFREQGVEDAFGIDGDWVDRAALRIPESSFEAVDLELGPQPPRRFDLVLSLEVAEHLSPDAADRFVDLLTGAGPVVAFSAAIPGQTGTGHVNEQWPSYWSERFAERGFVAFDLLRPRIWDDDRIAWWYRQNLVLFVEEARLGDYPQLGEPSEKLLPLVHPELFRYRVEATTPPPAATELSPAPVPPPLWQHLRSKVRLRTRLRALRERLRRRWLL